MYGYETFHEKTMLDLINAVRAKQARHAYIFEGDKGLFLYQSARLFAAALTCGNETSPCGECHRCKMSAADTNPDIITIEAEKSIIKVDTVRKIADDAYIKPFDSEKKVYIIKDADCMNAAAQNAFLKTLEEPPSFAVFILITPDSENLLQTVRSRCVTVRFASVSNDIVRRYIEKKYPDCENKEFLVRYAAGIPGNVDSAVSNEEFSALRQDAFDALARIMSSRRLDAYDAVDFMEQNKHNALLILEMWIDFVRDMLLIQNGCEKLAVNTDFLQRSERAANFFESEKIVHLLNLLIQAVKMQKRDTGGKNVRALALWLALGV